jgi:collagenase-like PrtC family protease
MGYRTFKIAGREMTTDWLVNAASAYARRSYDGNLTDILNGIAVMMGGGGPESRKMPHIDNRKLDGFLEYFRTVKCSLGCETCTYCQAVADDVVEPYLEENRQFIETLAMISENIV